MAVVAERTEVHTLADMQTDRQLEYTADYMLAYTALHITVLEAEAVAQQGFAVVVVVYTARYTLADMLYYRTVGHIEVYSQACIVEHIEVEVVARRPQFDSVAAGHTEDHMLVGMLVHKLVGYILVDTLACTEVHILVAVVPQ